MLQRAIGANDLDALWESDPDEVARLCSDAHRVLWSPRGGIRNESTDTNSVRIATWVSADSHRGVQWWPTRAAGRRRSAHG